MGSSHLRIGGARDKTFFRVSSVIWVRRILLLLPFVIAAVLNLLVVVARPMQWRSEHIAGYAFLFGTPWAWLTDHDWFGRMNNRWLENLITLLLILWIPAFLYSACLWLVFRVLGRWAEPRQRV